MPPPILPTSILTISTSPLAQSSFQTFGTAISSPLPATLTRAPSASSLPSLANASSNSSDFPPPILANQSTALKYSPISVFQNSYNQCKCPETQGSGKDADPRMSMFSCFPRALRRRGAQGRKFASGCFDVKILERHPDRGAIVAWPDGTGYGCQCSGLQGAGSHSRPAGYTEYESVHCAWWPSGDIWDWHVACANGGGGKASG
ncbi:predicted protein [Histoplasma mississippiense (nom. inval.)]|uniref:predicted protein n=1 Tax=Ajellomyces capsulatus (strain NAm1 / WU24) TaxID=2059318 RepID=UPI000157BD51|nr:predicted protein [Histoplasma mississippiense (nom. inval.)]EDN06154.1 predicted protein [Histoplasma mississippiense (nom. inval.)]